MDSYALKPGDVMKTGDNEWWACPPDCSFRQLSDGSWTCMDHDVECPGIKGGIRSYDHYPTDYVVNDENAQTGVMIKDASVVGSKKLDKTSVARAARTSKTANKTVSTMPKVQDKLGGVVLTYRCPDGCTSSNAGGSSGQTNGAFVASCVDAAGNECEVIWEVTETNASASPARAAKVESKVKQDSTNLKPVTSKAQDKVADGGAVAINCPAGCTPECAILGNTVLCECKTSNGSTCKAEVVVADDTTVLR